MYFKIQKNTGVYVCVCACMCVCVYVYLFGFFNPLGVYLFI